MSHDKYAHESCHIYEWDMSHIWMSHVTHMNEDDDDCFNYHPWKNNVVIVFGTLSSLRLSHVWMSYVTHMNEKVITHIEASCRTYEWRSVSHIYKSHVVRRLPVIIWMKRCITHMNESCHTYEWRGVSHCKSHTMSRLPVALILEINHIRHTHAERDNVVYWKTNRKIINDLQYTCTHITHINQSFHAYEWVVWRIRMSHAASSLSVAPILKVYSMGYMTHTNASCHAYEWVMSYINTKPPFSLSCFSPTSRRL